MPTPEALRREMQTVHAKWKDGRVCIDGPIDWPEGADLEVRATVANLEDIAFSDADVESTDSAAIARWLKEFEEFPRVEMADAEHKEMLSQRRTQREFDTQNFNRRVDRLIREELDG